MQEWELVTHLSYPESSPLWTRLEPNGPGLYELILAEKNWNVLRDAAQK
jgi:hypothetical protein